MHITRANLGLSYHFSQELAHNVLLCLIMKVMRGEIYLKINISCANFCINDLQFCMPYLCTLKFELLVTKILRMTLLSMCHVGFVQSKLNIWHNFLQKHADVIFSLPSKDDFLIKSVSIQTFTLEDIEVATERYKTLIGEGGFGSVYRGTLNDGQEVAVKVRSATSTQGTREFDNEVQIQ